MNERFAIGVFAACAVCLCLILAPWIQANQFSSGKFGLTSGSGTANRLAKFSNSSTLADSLISCDGTNCTLASGQLKLPDGTAANPSLSDSTSQFGLFFNGRLRFVATGAARWEMLSNAFRPSTDNANDFGLTTLRVRDGFFGRALGIHDGTNFTASLTTAGLELAAGKTIQIGGTAVKTVSTFTSDAAYNPASLSGGASRTDSVAVTGLVAGRALVCNPGTVADLGNCVYNCAAVSNGFAAIHWYNGDDGVGGSSCDPDETTWVFQQPAS